MNITCPLPSIVNCSGFFFGGPSEGDNFKRRLKAEQNLRSLISLAHAQAGLPRFGSGADSKLDRDHTVTWGAQSREQTLKHAGKDFSPHSAKAICK